MPVEYRGQPVSVWQKITAWADAYLHLGARVAVAIPEEAQGGSVAVDIEERPCSLRKTLLKVASYFTLVLPALAFTIKIVSRTTCSFYERRHVAPPFHERQRIAPASVDIAVRAVDAWRSLFASGMDADHMQALFDSCLQNLRKEGLVSTSEDSLPRGFIDRGDPIDVILTGKYIAEIADHLGLPYIKTPRAVALLTSENRPLELKASMRKGMVVAGDIFGLEVFVEEITPAACKASREQMLGLLKFFEATGFYDLEDTPLLMGRNQKGEEGIYFDRAYPENFSFPPDYTYMAQRGKRVLMELVAEEDREWLDQLLKEFLSRVRLGEGEYAMALEKRRALKRAWKERALRAQGAGEIADLCALKERP